MRFCFVTYANGMWTLLRFADLCLRLKIDVRQARCASRHHFRVVEPHFRLCHPHDQLILLHLAERSTYKKIILYLIITIWNLN